MGKRAEITISRQTLFVLFHQVSHSVVAMGFQVLRRNSSRRKSFKRLEPRERAQTDSSRGQRGADSAPNSQNSVTQEIGSALRSIGDKLNNSVQGLNTMFWEEKKAALDVPRKESNLNKRFHAWNAVPWNLNTFECTLLWESDCHAEFKLRIRSCTLSRTLTQPTARPYSTFLDFGNIVAVVSL